LTSVRDTLIFATGGAQAEIKITKRKIADTEVVRNSLLGIGLSPCLLLIIQIVWSYHIGHKEESEATNHGHLPQEGLRPPVLVS
jgi:hypothetical protein